MPRPVTSVEVFSRFFSTCSFAGPSNAGFFAFSRYRSIASFVIGVYPASSPVYFRSRTTAAGRRPAAVCSSSSVFSPEKISPATFMYGRKVFSLASCDLRSRSTSAIRISRSCFTRGSASFAIRARSSLPAASRSALLFAEFSAVGCEIFSSNPGIPWEDAPSGPYFAPRSSSSCAF